MKSKYRKILMIGLPVMMILILVIIGIFIVTSKKDALGDNPYDTIKEPVESSLEYDDIIITGADKDSLYYSVQVFSDGTWSGSVSFSLSEIDSPVGYDNVAVSGSFSEEEFQSLKSCIEAMIDSDREVIRSDESLNHLILSDATTTEHHDEFSTFLEQFNTVTNN